MWKNRFSCAINSKWTKLFLLCFIFYSVERFCHKQTEGFRTHKIASDLAFDPKWSIPSLTDNQLIDLKTELDQPYYFLGSGGQCYAFISEDKEYVIKFFKHHHMRPNHWADHLPAPAFLKPLQKKFLDFRLNLLDRIFSSFKLAYDHLKEETALVYLHLNKTDLFHQKLIIYDKLGIDHQIDLDKTTFALQKKASLAFPTLKMLYQNKNLEQAKRCINSLVDLIIIRSKRGIFDQDPHLKRNFAFIEDKAIEIDLGSFSFNPYLKRPNYWKKEIFFETIQLKKWTKKHCPDLFPFVESLILEKISEEI